jgi:hypothetical protein
MATPLHAEHIHSLKTMTSPSMIYSSSPALIGNERNSYYPLGSPLQSPLAAPENPSRDAKLAMQEIAKEALRLTKQTLAQDCAKLDKGAYFDHFSPW